MKIVSIKKLESTKVFDIEVENAHHYVLENGVITHNSGAQYSTSTTIFLSKSKDKDGDKNQIGVIIKARVMKGRFVKEGSECEMKLSFKNGLDKYYGLLDLVEKYGIFKKVATKFELPTGEKVYGKDIYANPEKYFTKDILDQIDDAAKKEFMYGE